MDGGCLLLCLLPEVFLTEEYSGSLFQLCIWLQVSKESNHLNMDHKLPNPKHRRGLKRKHVCSILLQNEIRPWLLSKETSWRYTGQGQKEQGVGEEIQSRKFHRQLPLSSRLTSKITNFKVKKHNFWAAWWDTDFWAYNFYDVKRVITALKKESIRPTYMQCKRKVSAERGHWHLLPTGNFLLMSSTLSLHQAVCHIHSPHWCWLPWEPQRKSTVPPLHQIRTALACWTAMSK